MVAERGERWGAMKHWGACSSVRKSVEWRRWILEEAKEQQCYSGFSLGCTNDFPTLVLVFPKLMAPKWLVLPFFWVPQFWQSQSMLHGSRIYSQKHMDWIKWGFMTETAGNVTDYTRVRADVQGLSREYGIQELAIDRAFQGDQMAIQLFNEDGIKIIPFGQGFLSMAAPSKRFEELVLSGKLEHGNNPILEQMAANITIVTDVAGNMKPWVPLNSATLGWNGLTATIMAIGRAMANED